MCRHCNAKRTNYLSGACGFLLALGAKRPEENNILFIG
jgi:hypothetical protein